MPKVSFLVAVYNVAPFIEQCAQSLFEQTLDDIEIIFVNDCTPDNSVQIIQSLLTEYPGRAQQVKVINHAVNQGTAITRWDAAMAATGEYVLFADGDDYLEPNMGEALYEKAHATDADIVVCDCYWGDKPTAMSIPGDDQRELLLRRKITHSVWNRLFKRSLLYNPDLVWPKCHMADDLVISFVLTTFARKVEYLPIPLYHYRYNPNSIMNQRSEPQMLKSFNQQVQNTNILIDFWEKQGLVETYESGYYCILSDARNGLLPLTHKRQYRKLWHSTYPQVNKLIFWGNKNHPSSFRNKIWYLAIMLGLYPRFRRVLLSRRLRPSLEWRWSIPLKSKHQ